MQTQAESTHALGKPDVVVTVNERPVAIAGPKATGAQIKTAAIEQGVPIQQDFLLYEERHNNTTRPVPDDEPVVVNKQSRFRAVAGDDNS